MTDNFSDQESTPQPDPRREFGLRRFAHGEGEALVANHTTPIPFDDPEAAWIVQGGRVDVFAVPLRDGEQSAARAHLFRAEVGQVLFGMDISPFAERIAIIGIGTQGTRLQKLDRSRLHSLGADPDYSVEVAVMLENWVKGLSRALGRDTALRQYEPLELGKALSLPVDGLARVKKGILWVTVTEGEVLFNGLDVAHVSPGQLPLPVTERTWLQAVQPSVLHTDDTETLIEADTEWKFLDAFHWLALDCVLYTLQVGERIERERLRLRRVQDQAQVSGSLRRLAGVLKTQDTLLDDDQQQQDEPLVMACRLVGQALGVQIRRRPDPVDGRVEAQTLDSIARASRIGMRRVQLRAGWWRGDNGPLLGYLRDGGHPVALLPTSPRSYEVINPVDQTRRRVSAKVAETISPHAVMFYRTLPRHALSASHLDLLRFGLFKVRGDLQMVVIIGLAAGLLGLVTPIFIGILFDSIIPTARDDLLLQFCGLLLVAAVATALFQVTRTLAVLRIEVKFEAALQAAIWDRLLNLPVPFFRGYTAGDLSTRAMGVSSIRRAVSGAVTLAVLTGVFSIFNFILLFTIDLNLALLATLLFVVAVVVTLIAGYALLRYQRVIADVQGKIAGMVLQFLTGITKLRVAGVEGRAFTLWARDFSEQKRLAFRSRTLQNALSVFHAAYPILTTMALFAAVSGERSELSTGAFLAFYAAFTQFLLASLDLSAAFLNLLNIVPVYERLQPILKAEPEVDEAKADPGTLTGEIEVNRVSFRYREGGLQVLRDVSFHIKPGEFVALVGPSGSGKSTLFRILLGFEKPESGAIFYDGQDLAGLDIRAVRQQMGVVLQNSQLMYGDVFTNIVGVTNLTLDDAWAAAKMAGLDEDIRAMPMGMHTLISEGGTTLSGGQRQRLLIARAIASKPRILFFDEATSALDNQTQAIVSRSLESLDATRIVIAHRLSTIINADRILVMQNGRILQSGSYDQLMAQGGLFAELAKRQLM